MMKVWQILTAAVAAGALALGGCGDNSGGGGTATTGTAGGGTAGGKEIIIGVVAKSVSNPVFQAAHAGARDAANELGGKYNATITINIQTPPDEDAAKQAEAIDMLVRQGAKGIAVSCSNANTLKPAIDRAVDKGVPVMCFDSDAPDSKRFCYYGTDDATCGVEVVKLLAAEMGDKGTVAILGGNESAPNLRTRVKAAQDELKKHPGMKELASGPVYHEETPAKAAEKLQETQRANPDIAGWAMIGGWPLFTRNALPWQPGAVKVVSVDALPDQISYIQSGHVQVLLAQDCYGWGHKSVEILMEKIVNNKDPESVKIYDPLTHVTKDNAAEFSKKWDKWLSK
jgi:ribose transport system substrate-binding protein